MENFFTERGEQQQQRINKIFEILKIDARTKLTKISKETGIPVSTVFDIMKRIKGKYEFVAVNKEKKKIIIHVWKGLIDRVENIPDGFDYEIKDHDVVE